ncbi:SDR family NAD(P)-dependent oxidoreductase [Ferrovibrio xuzhouensis]|uniref:SDR family NAD(P)-dependent oxidoreductase n=1 Tax=Ferrovibrio xuzhouensis TaxID=1576914 RepID=A0ABV7VGQ2_9PROT
MSTPGVVWITGAGSGIGRATALRFLRAGAMVAGTARRAETLEAVAAAARDFTGRFHALPADLTDSAATGDVVRRIERDIGPLRLALLNAGSHEPTPGNAFRADAVRRLLDSNVMTVANSLQAVLPPLLARRAGQIAIVASVAGYSGLPTAAAYGASKAALINMAEALRLDLQDSGVAVRLVCPGFVRTPLTDRNSFPMPFLMPVEAAAERLWHGLEFGQGFEIVFPRRFALILKTLRLLPYAAYFPLVRRMTR